MINNIGKTRAFFSFLLFFIFIFVSYHHRTFCYLLRQGNGQLKILLHSEQTESYIKTHKMSAHELENLLLVQKIKSYSVDSLAYDATNNYNTIFEVGNKPVLWVITASEPFALSPYEWQFPIVGQVSYKGFFKEELARDEERRLKYLGYDVSRGAVSAWSTLGWFNDPLFSNMLRRTKGDLCNLLFHELFHATYYASGSVEKNENLANFISDHATVQFLRNDSAALKSYCQKRDDEMVYNNFMHRQTIRLKKFYKKIERLPSRQSLKNKEMDLIADSIDLLPLVNKQRFHSRSKALVAEGNAYFIEFEQYDGMADTLEKVFNKIYRGDLKKLVQDLKLNGFLY
jgi:predicted aminopeptidase